MNTITDKVIVESWHWKNTQTTGAAALAQTTQGYGRCIDALVGACFFKVQN